MISIARWLFFVLLILVFSNSCSKTCDYVWERKAAVLVRPYREADRAVFPVVIRLADGHYLAGTLGNLPEGAQVVKYMDMDTSAINAGINAMVGTAGYPYFEQVDFTLQKAEVSLEAPGGSLSMRKGWYELERDGKVVPLRILQYGPGFVFEGWLWGLGGGVLAGLLFRLIFRPKRKALREVQPGGSVRPA